MKLVKSFVLTLVTIVMLSACATTTTIPTNSQTEHKSYFGKWTLVKIVYPNGESKDFSDQPANYIHITENEISENMPGYGIKTYNYMEKDNTLIIMAGNRLSAWTIKNSSQNTLEIETAAGVYLLER